jgi:hypothetical protein
MNPPSGSSTGSTDRPAELVLGPLLRHVDTESAAVWVETDAACQVSVRAGERRWSAATFAVHGHHYALVECTGLEPGSEVEYAVELEQRRVWPPESHGQDLDLPPSVIATLPDDRPPRLLFGSCRTSVSHDAKGNLTHGVDAMRAFALALARVTSSDEPLVRPDLVLFLGDQVYADETSEEMQEFIASRRDIDEPPGEELADYEEYAHLYKLAWSDPANRWLLSTLPSAMIFDDHDIRDDWNTSARWRREMESTDWWHGRIVAGLASYWVYQHLGNLTSEERSRDEIWQLVVGHEGDDELDLSATLDTFAERVDKRPETYRWSFARRLGDIRLVVVDSRAARVLREDRRSMLDPDEMAWLDEHMQGDCEHLLVGTSLPFLLPEGLHHLEAFSEALAGGAWGRRGVAVGEKLRQGADLEHWGAFQEGFQDVARMAAEVATGHRGTPPRTVTFLSGDVHHSYVSQVRDVPGEGTILQAVCSPIRNPLPRVMRLATAALAYGIATPLGRAMSRSASVPGQPFRWDSVRGPWFDNNIATLLVTTEGLEMHWTTGEVTGGGHERPDLRRVATVRVGPGKVVHQE